MTGLSKLLDHYLRHEVCRRAFHTIEVAATLAAAALAIALVVLDYVTGREWAISASIYFPRVWQRG
jgi:hypothetical protein